MAIRGLSQSYHRPLAKCNSAHDDYDDDDDDDDHDGDNHIIKHKQKCNNADDEDDVNDGQTGHKPK